MWRNMIPEELTRREVAFMQEYLQLQPGDSVLDLMCGYGRHALALGRMGIRVTAVDNLPAYIAEIRETADREQLPVQAICQPVQTFTGTTACKLAICMGNSFNFFSRPEATQLLQQTAAQVIQGGHLLISSWSIAEIVYSKLNQQHGWSREGEYLFLSDARFHLQPARLEVETIMLAPDGSREIKKGIDYIYSINELEQLFTTAGFRLTGAWSVPPKKQFVPGDVRVYLLAERQ